MDEARRVLRKPSKKKLRPPPAATTAQDPTPTVRRPHATTPQQPQNTTPRRSQSATLHWPGTATPQQSAAPEPQSTVTSHILEEFDDRYPDYPITKHTFVNAIVMLRNMLQGEERTKPERKFAEHHLDAFVLNLKYGDRPKRRAPNYIVWFLEHHEQDSLTISTQVPGILSKRKIAEIMKENATVVAEHQARVQKLIQLAIDEDAARNVAAAGGMSKSD